MFDQFQDKVFYDFMESYTDPPEQVGESFVKERINSIGVQLLGMAKKTPDWIIKIAKDKKWIII